MKALNVKKMGGAAKQAGFTIIELVVVILLLGILTATALPRFLDISDDAHAAVVNAHLGSLATGVSLYRAAWFAQGKPSGATTVDYLGTGGTLLASANGYPSGITTDATGNFPNDHTDCARIFNDLMQTGGTSQNSEIAIGTLTTPGAYTVATTAPAGLILPGAGTPTNWVGGAGGTGEWAAQMIDTDATADVANAACDFYYMGQFVAPASTVRVIRYFPVSGDLSVLTSAALAGGV